jgi:hypothetical protein
MINCQKTPSIYSYSYTSSGEAQRGSDLSPNAILSSSASEVTKLAAKAMINSKLELDLRSLTDELDLILSTLDGVQNLQEDCLKAVGRVPDYPWKSPEEKVTDYLSKVFACSKIALSRSSEELLLEIPTDVVIIRPTVVKHFV